MGRPYAPIYGEDLGSAIETAKKVIARIETNKYDKEDLVELAQSLKEILNVVEKDED